MFRLVVGEDIFLVISKLGIRIQTDLPERDVDVLSSVESVDKGLSITQDGTLSSVQLLNVVFGVS